MAKVIALSKADLHLHTTESDGAPSVEQLLDHIAQTDLQVIAVTDHDTIRGAEQAYQLSHRRGSPVEIIIGEEVSSRDGHILGLWLQSPIPPGLTAAETVAAIHAQGGLALAAHPFFRTRRPGHPGLLPVGGVGRLLRQIPFDGVETINGTPCLQVPNLRARRYNRRFCRLPEIGGSDAHILAAVGKSHTLFPGRSAADLRRAIETGRVRAARAWYRPRDLLAYAAFWVRIARDEGRRAIR